MALVKLYQNPTGLLNTAAKPDAASALAKPATVMGINIKACAKMIGITPAAFTFRGMYWRTPPYCLLPTMRLAYCTGIRRVP